jgi:hypothetical protein
MAKPPASFVSVTPVRSSAAVGGVSAALGGSAAGAGAGGVLRAGCGRARSGSGSASAAGSGVGGGGGSAFGAGTSKLTTLTRVSFFGARGTPANEA